MNDTLSGLVGAALIISLFVAYARQRRAARPSEPVVIETTPEVAADVNPRGSSPNWGAPIVFCLLLIGAETHRDSWWGTLWQVLYFAFIAVAAYSTFSPKEFAAEQARRPDTTLKEHYIKLGIPYLFVPLLAYTLAIPLGIHAAVLLPALPWVFLLAAGLFGARSTS